MHQLRTNSHKLATNRLSLSLSLSNSLRLTSLLTLSTLTIISLALLGFLVLLNSFFITSLNSSNSKVSAASLESELEVEVSDVLALSIINCDSTSSSVVKLGVQPTPSGTFKSNCQTVVVNTNALGYNLTARSSSADLIYQNPNTLQNLPFIPSTSNVVNTPNTLVNNTWGFAVEANTNLGFDNTYTIDNANNKFAQLPTTDLNIYEESGNWPLQQTEHMFYYATSLTTATVAGTYGTTITYTAIGEPAKPLPCQDDNIICIKVTEAGTVALRNIWSTPITYSIDGSDPISLATNTLSSNIDVSVGNTIEVKEGTDDVTFRTWANVSNRGFITNATSTGTARVSVTKMPPMNRFTTDNTGTTTGNYFFRYFAGSSSASYPSAINSLPNGSFDTSNITSTGTYFFSYFNRYGALTSLPAGSFDIKKITTAEEYFFHSFNFLGALTSLPAGSFDTSNITASVGRSFFYAFNNSGALTSLPAGSFDTSNITSVGGAFFGLFNNSGALTSLPAGSFDTSNITSADFSFFASFNYSGNLTTLPTGSFNISKMTSAEDRFFSDFNNSGALTTLPIGSFDTSKITSSAKDYFFSGFNNSGSLTVLPVGSFDISSITLVENHFFSNFNPDGDLTSLPTGSFDTSNITSVGAYFFFAFNSNGAITSLPVGSFNTSNITSAGGTFFSSFNGGSATFAGRLQAPDTSSASVTITNKSSGNVTFWRRPFGDPDGTATSTSVLAGNAITFLGE